MGFVAEASIDSNEPPEALFDRLVDHEEWFRFMPRSFRPMGKPKSKLKVGDRVTVRIAGLPSPIFISTVLRPNELAWTGGRRGILYAEHRFVFEARGSGTRVRSIETWDGILTPFLRPFVKRMAERVGKQQLKALCAYSK